MNNNNNIVNATANVADAVQELRKMADRELASDARKAHADVTEAVEELLAIIEEQKAEIKRLRMERDEARREVCEMTPRYEGRHDDTFEESRGVAVERGWDCFKEETP